MMNFTIDDLFTKREESASEILSIDNVECPLILPEPGTVGSGEWLFAFKSWRLDYNGILKQFNNWILITDVINYFETLTKLFTDVLENLDTVHNHSAVRIFLYDNCTQWFPSDLLSQFPERSFFIQPKEFDFRKDDGNYVVFSADVKFNSVQSMMRTFYSLANCFAISGLEHLENKNADNLHDSIIYRQLKEDSYENMFSQMKLLHSVMSRNSGAIDVSTKQHLLRDLMNRYTTFNNFTPSLHAYNYLCKRLNTNLSSGLFAYSIQLKTKQILQHITEVDIDFYIKNKFDYCTMNARVAMSKNHHRCFFTTDDIGLGTAAQHTTLDFDDLEDETAQSLKRYFEENDYQMTFDGSLFAIAELRNENVDYILSIFRMGAFEYPNIFYNDKHSNSRLSLSPTTIKETGFVVCTKLSNPDTAFDRHFELLRELIVDKNIIEYEEIKYHIKNWYTSRNISAKDYMWK